MKDDILQPFTTQDYFITDMVNAVGENALILDMFLLFLMYDRKKVFSAQALKPVFNSDPMVLARIVEYALMLTVKTFSIDSDVQRHFDLI